MATWLDGPEYAPLARPDAFDVPEAAPLEDAPPVPRPAAAPADRPAFDQPATPVPSLAELVPEPADRRDPAEAFAVVSSSLTAGGAWSSAHGSPPATPAADLPLGTAATWPEPGPAVPAATGTPFPSAYPADGVPTPPPAPPPATFPAPGTPQWFGPGPYGEQPAPVRAGARAIADAATPGLLIVLGIGIIFSALAPVLLGVAFALSRRIQVGSTVVRRGFAIALGALVVLALLGLLTDPVSLGDWWLAVGRLAQLTNAVMAVVTVVLVRRALLAGEGPPAPPPPVTYRGPWG